MDSFYTQSPHTLTNEQMAILAAVALEEFGARQRHLLDEVLLRITRSVRAAQGKYRLDNVWVEINDHGLL